MTVEFSMSADAFDDFNSHARVGRDYVKKELLCYNEISTHTPAWGVTQDYNSDKAALEEFQLTRPRGA